VGIVETAGAGVRFWEKLGLNKAGMREKGEEGILERVDGHFYVQFVVGIRA